MRPHTPGTSIPKGFRGGTHRLVPPEVTLKRIAPMLAPMGITRTANITGLDRLRVPVAACYRPNARSLSVTQGKGLSLAAAKASAQMEAIESFHAERIVRPVIHATLNDLRFRQRVVDITRLPQLSVSTFHKNQRTLWMEAYDWLDEAPVWVPYESVHTDFTLPLPPGSGAFLMSSNGLASGNHLLEAISHGVCEVVERDAVTLFRRTPPERQRMIELASVDDMDCRDVLERFRQANVSVGVWDATSDIGLPCFYCAIVDADPDPFRPMYANQGMGCHPSRGIALLRALTEAAQSRLTFIAGARDDAGRSRYRAVRSAEYVGRWRARIQRPRGISMTFHQVLSFDHDTLDEDVDLECACLRRVGFEQVAVVDLTREEFGIPVVRVVIPGLEPLDDVPGYKPGPRALAVTQYSASPMTAAGATGEPTS